MPSKTLPTKAPRREFQPGADVMGGCEIRKSLTGWLKTYTKWHVYHQLVQDFATIHRMKPCLKCVWPFQNKSQLVTSSLIRMWPCLVNLGLGWIGELPGQTSTTTSDSSYSVVSTMEIPVLCHGFSRSNIHFDRGFPWISQLGVSKPPEPGRLLSAPDSDPPLPRRAWNKPRPNPPHRCTCLHPGWEWNSLLLQ